jgi:hypothetical protein
MVFMHTLFFPWGYAESHLKVFIFGTNPPVFGLALPLKSAGSSYLRVDNLDPNFWNPPKSFSLTVEGGCSLPLGESILSSSSALLKRIDLFYLRVNMVSSAFGRVHLSPSSALLKRVDLFYLRVNVVSSAFGRVHLSPSSALLKRVDSSYLRVDNLDPNFWNP